MSPSHASDRRPVRRALICGGGIAGLATAVGLQRAGIECEIVERFPGPIPTIMISLPDHSLERVQRRAFFRLGANVPVGIEPRPRV